MILLFDLGFRLGANILMQYFGEEGRLIAGPSLLRES